MNFMKENLTTIIVITLIIIIVLGVGVFCWKVAQVEDEKSNVTIAKSYSSFDDIDGNYNNSSENENIIIDNNYINMSKYYLSTSHGRVAEIYNNMLDSLGKQKNIVETSRNSECIKSTIDLNKMCFLSEYDNSYECWAYVGGLQKKYKYNYSTGEIEKNSEVSLWMKSDADFVAFAIDFDISDELYNWNYGYNENISRNGYQCYEIVANWSEEDNNGSRYYSNGTEKLYIDMNTYKLIEIETTSVLSSNNKVIEGTYNKFYEYLDNSLEIPEDAKNYIYN